MFKHYIVTRFNLRVEEWSYTKNQEDILTEEWLDHRFKLFRTFCLPSMINQANQSYTWLVFFDIDTTDKYRRIIKAISKNFENFKPLFVDSNNALLASLIGFIKNDTSNEDYVITSRVDNDDCIHMDYVKEIQSCFNKQESCVVDIVDGYQIILNENSNKQISEFRKARGYYNPFISLIEKADDPKTVMNQMHFEWENSKQQVIIHNKRLWAEIIHHKNKLNDVRPLAEFTNKFPHDAFAITYTDIEIKSSFHIFILNVNVNRLRIFKWVRSKFPKRIKKAIKHIITRL